MNAASDLPPRSAASRSFAARFHAALRPYAGTPLNAAISSACLVFVIWVGAPFLRWAVLDATWTGTAADCRARSGACWAFVADKFSMSIFGLYPYEERWRPGLVLCLFALMVVVSMQRRLWSRTLIHAWVLLAVLFFVLMRGGFLSLPLVSTQQWGGLTVTIFVALFGLATGYPGAVALALGRRSERVSVRWMSTAIIETVRGVPLISLIFMAAIMAPIFLPAGFEIDRLFRVQLAYTLFSSAYLAEVIRGGLQGVDRGQEEAARSLGLGYWARMRLVVLPQALTTTIPAQVNTFITLFKDTTLVVIVGIFDLFTTLRAAMGDSHWLGFSAEAYLYAAFVYLSLCLVMSRYSRHLETVLKPRR